MTSPSAHPNIYPVILNLNDQSFDKKAYSKLITAMLRNQPAANAIMVIELSGIQSLTANNLSTLVYCKQYAEKKGLGFILKGVSPVLKAFFELTRLNNFFLTTPAFVG